VFGDIDATSNKKFLVRASFLEIYNEDIRRGLTPGAHTRPRTSSTLGVFVTETLNPHIDSHKSA